MTSFPRMLAAGVAAVSFSASLHTPVQASPQPSEFRDRCLFAGGKVIVDRAGHPRCIRRTASGAVIRFEPPDPCITATERTGPGLRKPTTQAIDPRRACLHP